MHFDVKSSNLLLGYRDRRPVCKVWVGLAVWGRAEGVTEARSLGAAHTVAELEPRLAATPWLMNDCRLDSQLLILNRCPGGRLWAQQAEDADLRDGGWQRLVNRRVLHASSSSKGGCAGIVASACEQILVLHLTSPNAPVTLPLARRTLPSPLPHPFAGREQPARHPAMVRPLAMCLFSGLGSAAALCRDGVLAGQ